ncbi:anti-sigma factor [Variovorax sp. RKNM96]|uniref:anti-sigma factor family protein n=1 Tax=Variovorax sp. RKNM96 TaxID=2681552 RepID=UPI00198227E8|nr:anti-sigma factor [Variovorax sp. RKNM96]
MNGDPMDARPILEEDLHAYVDDVLDAPRRREVREYLDRHPEAAREVEAYALHRQGLREALAPVAEEPLPPSLNLARLVEEHQRPGQQARHAPQHHWPWGMAAAVVFALGLGASAGWSLRGGVLPTEGDAGIPALAREATRSYVVYASDTVRPVEMGPSQRAELVDWVSSRLGRKVAIPDLTASGYTFIGGRLVMTAHGPAGLFMYDDADGARLALTVRPMTVDKDTPVMRPIEGAVAGYAWADKGLGYGVVGARKAEVLHPLADEMRRQIGVSLRG